MELQKIKKGIRKWAAIYLGAVSCILIPLFMRHGYYSLIYWKSRAYLYAAIPAAAVVAVVEAADLFLKLTWRTDKTTGKLKNRIRIKKPPVSVILLLSIAAWSLFCSYMSQNPGLSMMGTAGWSMGSLMTTVLVLSTIIVSQYFDLKPYMLFAVMAVNIVINGFAIIQSAGIDLFGLLKNIDKKHSKKINSM